MKAAFKSIAASFKNLLFPEGITCDVCKQELKDNTLICDNCLKKIPFIHNCCQKCGCNIISGQYCIRCKSTAYEFDCNYAVCSYDDFTKNIIFRFKCGDRYLYKFIAAFMAKMLIKNNTAFDIITYVPVTEKVKRQRGYNQSFLLAENISVILNLPLYKGLIKIKETKFQKNCTAKERKENVKNAFSAINKNQILQKNILLIDDVITTGSTLSECGRVLYKGGAKSVVTCTFTAVEPLISTETP